MTLRTGTPRHRFLFRSTALQYDANGNMIFDGKRTFTLDDANQLIAITTTNQWRSEFVLRWIFGRRRIRKEVHGRTACGCQRTSALRVRRLLAIQEARLKQMSRSVNYTRALI